MEAETEAVPNTLPIVVVKTEPTEVVEVAEVIMNNANTNVSINTNMAVARKERREFAKFAKAAKKFAKTLPDLNPIRKTMRKSIVIPEKEAPAPENVIAAANTDSDMSEVKSVEQVNSVKSVEELLEADQKAFEAEFGHIETDSATVNDEPDEFDEDDIDIEPIC